jgi:5,6-dimethylbenzimidazole synthase
MQPWRFIRIRDRSLRGRIHALVDEERARTAAALGEREEEFMRLKVEGILECGELLVAGLAPDRDKHVFGRRTMPEMDLASVACAIQNMWLAARAEGVGMGWVSLFDPEALRQLLRMPAGAKPVAVLCLGRVPEFYPRPMLEMVQWTLGCSLERVLHTDYWGRDDGAELGAD